MTRGIVDIDGVTTVFGLSELMGNAMVLTSNIFQEGTRLFSNPDPSVVSGKSYWIVPSTFWLTDYLTNSLDIGTNFTKRAL